jgi:hypothetical protein
VFGWVPTGGNPVLHYSISILTVMLYEEILTRILCKKWVYSKNKYKTVLSKELLLLVYANKKKMLFSDKSTQKLNIINLHNYSTCPSLPSFRSFCFLRSFIGTYGT